MNENGRVIGMASNYISIIYQMPDGNKMAIAALRVYVLGGGCKSHPHTAAHSRTLQVV